MRTGFKRLYRKLTAANKTYGCDSVQLSRLLNEIIWANVYHDSIRSCTCLNNLSMFPGRWAANYSLLYLLYRILSDVKPSRILEFGLGESSKLISNYIENELPSSRHCIIEHDYDWIAHFRERYNLSAQSLIHKVDLQLREVRGKVVNTYAGLDFEALSNYDLFVIDGPFGSEHISRIEILDIVCNFDAHKKFIIILDDYNRSGEKRMADRLISTLKFKHRDVQTQKFYAQKDQLLITSSHYKWVTSI